MYDFGEGVPSARESNRDTGRALLTQDLTQVLKDPDNLRNNLDRPGHFGHRVYRCRYLHAGRKQCKSDEVRPTLQRGLDCGVTTIDSSPDALVEE